MKKSLLILILLFSSVPLLSQAACCRIRYTCGWMGYSLNGTYVETTTEFNCVASLNTLKSQLTSLKSSLNSAITNNKCSCAVNVGDENIISLGTPGKPPIWDSAACTESDNGLLKPEAFDKVKCAETQTVGSETPADTDNSGASPQAAGSVRRSYTTLPNPLGPQNMTLGDVPKIVGKVINAVLGIIGAIALLVVIYGGFLWMTSAGNESQVAKGKSTLMWAAIALAIIFLAWILVSFLFQALGVANY